MNFTLRPWRPEDASAIVPYADDPLVAQNLRDVFPCPYTLADAEGFIHSCIEREGQGQLCRAIEVDGTAVGSISLILGTDVYRRSAELGYWLGRPFWRQGVMTAAVKELCALGFETWDVARIYAEPYAKNAGSRGVLERAGFRLEGIKRKSVFKHGELLDSCVYARLRGEAEP